MDWDLIVAAFVAVVAVVAVWLGQLNEHHRRFGRRRK